MVQSIHPPNNNAKTKGLGKQLLTTISSLRICHIMFCKFHYPYSSLIFMFGKSKHDECEMHVEYSKWSNMVKQHIITFFMIVINAKFMLFFKHEIHLW
jgi:hypothetical protein